jgi:hypothetical protein
MAGVRMMLLIVGKVCQIKSDTHEWIGLAAEVESF